MGDPLTYFAKRKDRLWGALGLAILCAGGFAAICQFNVSRHGLEHAPIIQALRVDAAIPFVPGCIWIYLLYYPFCFLPIGLREVRDDPKTFMRTALAFGIQFGASFVIFLVWPLRMAHPALVGGLDGRVLRHLYAFDLGFNSFPSLHVANIVFVSLLYWRKRGPRWGAIVAALAALIAASTMLVKQHFAGDVAAGALLGWFSFVSSFGWSGVNQ